MNIHIQYSPKVMVQEVIFRKYAKIIMNANQIELINQNYLTIFIFYIMQEKINNNLG